MPAVRKPSATGFQAIDVTQHLGTPTAGILPPSSMEYRKTALELAEKACTTGDARQVAQALVFLIRSLPT